MDELDIADFGAVTAFPWKEFEVVVNASAFTDVDRAETLEGSSEAWRVNALGVANLAAAARSADLVLVHISTDYVFDGLSGSPYAEDHPVNPMSVYGRSKAAGDLAAASVARHYILRTSWLYGDGPRNFPSAILRKAEMYDTIDVVCDQRGRPTYARDLASTVAQLLRLQAPWGIYNCQNAGEIISWAQFARAVLTFAGQACQVNEIPSAALSLAAARPAFSALDITKLERAGAVMRHWHDGLADYMARR